MNETMKPTIPLIIGSLAAQLLAMTLGIGSWELIAGFIAGVILCGIRQTNKPTESK